MEKRSEAEWRELTAEYKSSGLEQRAWCEAKGINLFIFRDRLSKLRKSGTLVVSNPKADDNKDETKRELVQSEDVSWLTVTQETEIRGSKIKVGIGDFEITVAHDFDESAFIKVCRVLMKLC